MKTILSEVKYPPSANRKERLQSSSNEILLMVMQAISPNLATSLKAYLKK